MKHITLDYETFYSADYSLRKMTPVEYILDQRFETIGCAVKEGDGKAFWLTEGELVAYLAGYKRSKERVAMVSHNALFDMCITAWRYDFTPHIMIDTLGLSRAWLGHKLRSHSLASVAAHLGIGIKGGTVHKVQGMGLAAIKASGFYDEYAEYSCNDAALCWDIYRKIMAQGFPVRELAVMDTVLRCAVQPSFELNQELLHRHLHVTQEAKASLMSRVGMASRDDLMSNDRFAEALRALGVEPPTKVSLTTGKETYAFAKTDADFMDLEEHDDPAVQALVSARLGIKSTIEETRTDRLISISNLNWPDGRHGVLPMALRYSGAHTHRLSGDWRLNCQNLPSRGNTALRDSMEAPKGYKVVGVDASQIEARGAADFCGQTSMVNAFANKEDIYSTFASSVFGYEVNRKAHPVQRFIGKTAVLGLQYNLGWPKFQKTVAMQSKAQVGEEVMLSDEEAARVVQLYRTTYSAIPAMWQRLQKMLPKMTQRGLEEWIGPVKFEFERILLPSGLYLSYNELRCEDNQWRFTYGGKTKYIYGGKMLENIIQALARICVMDAAVRIRNTYGYQLKLQVHDELVYVVPEADAETVMENVIKEMRVRPSWAPNLPLDAEGGIGPSFGQT